MKTFEKLIIVTVIIGVPVVLLWYSSQFLPALLVALVGVYIGLRVSGKL